MRVCKGSTSVSPVRLDLTSREVTDIVLGSRRLLTYRRLPDSEVASEKLLAYKTSRLELGKYSETASKETADDLNDFRRRVSSQMAKIVSKVHIVAHTSI